MLWKWVIPAVFLSLVNPYPTLFTAAEDVVDSFAFNVQPGGDKHIISRSLGPFECHFLYAAQGGTNEEWYINLSSDHDGKVYKCLIGRPTGTSYLLFETFKVSIHGANIKTVDASVDMDTILDDSQYSINYDQNEVSNIDGMFQNQLAMITVTAEGMKTEL